MTPATQKATATRKSKIKKRKTIAKKNIIKAVWDFSATLCPLLSEGLNETNIINRPNQQMYVIALEVYGSS